MNQEVFESTIKQALISYQQQIPSPHLPPKQQTGASSNIDGHQRLDTSSAQNTSVSAISSAPSASSAPSSSLRETSNGIVKPEPRKRKPYPKRTSKKRSWVWNWFAQDPQDYNIAVCDQCGKIVRRVTSDKGSPKKLLEHLRTHKIDHLTASTTKKPIPSGLDGGQLMNISVSGGSTIVKSVPTPVFPMIGPSGSVGVSVADSATLSGSVFEENQEGNLKTVAPGGYSRVPHNILSEFDLTPYSRTKFHKDIMKFLTENKLPISIVKTHSFRQMVFTLRPESVEDLNELNNIYSSLMEVLKNNDSSTGHMTSAHDSWAMARASNVINDDILGMNNDSNHGHAGNHGSNPPGQNANLGNRGWR